MEADAKEASIDPTSQLVNNIRRRSKTQNGAGYDPINFRSRMRRSEPSSNMHKALDELGKSREKEVPDPFRVINPPWAGPVKALLGFTQRIYQPGQWVIRPTEVFGLQSGLNISI
jgi:hypothetical protein